MTRMWVVVDRDFPMNDMTDDQRRRLLDALPCYVTLQDRESRVLWSNRLTRRDFGEPSGRTCYEFYGIDGDKCTDCPVRKTLEDGHMHNTEMTLTTKDRSRINVLVQSAPLHDEQGEIVGVIETLVNVTSVKNIQKQLILLGETIAGMAHSMKNIMMGLEGGIYVVNRGIEDKNQNEVKEGWEMVLLNFEKISHIVKDILYCAKEREPNLQKIDPNRVVRDAYDLFKETAKRYAIEISLDLDENLKEAVIDPSELHAVLANLLTNAMDACKIDLWKDEHLVEMRTRRGRNGATIIEVADNGIGIDKDLKDHVFEDFFSSKGNQGTGLGLMVTQKILREHGGNITFRSRPGQGTTFVATFPGEESTED
ncbi:nitrogen regulation protein NR(II) [Thermodesulfobacteriota bacterium]